MSLSSSIIRDGKESYRIDITNRDWGLLHEPLFDVGQHFIHVFGVYENPHVGSLRPGTQVRRDQLHFLNASMCLLDAIQKNENLFCHDYSYKFSTENKIHRLGKRFKVRGLSGDIDTQPHGFCYLKLWQHDMDGKLRIAEVIDMRIKGSIETDELGTLKIYRKKAQMRWLETLPPLIDFLRSRGRKELIIEHYDRASQVPV
jgi:hypothetical protein